MMDERITVFAGHYGGGKTNIAVNYALYLKNKVGIKDVVLADLDIVNPYFRSADAVSVLEQEGVRVIASGYAGSNLEAFSVPEQAAAVFDDKSVYGVIDLGGDDRGAVAMGRYKGHIENEKSKNILLVVNCYRPLSRDVKEIVGIKDEIEAAAGFRFNGIVNNSNLGADTAVKDVLDSLGIINEVSCVCSLPVVMTCADVKTAAALGGEIADLFELNLNIPSVLKGLL
jgi:hypothetical protein